MPYASNRELPENVKILPPGAQRIWRKAFNAGLEQYGSEDRARKTAWTAVKNSYTKIASGKWVQKESSNMAKTQSERFFEFASQSKTDIEFDEDNLVIKNVSLLGNESRDTNGKLIRRFTNTAMDEFAKKAEGGQLYWNHPGEGELKEHYGHRDIRRMAGVILNVRKDGAKARGDIQAFTDTWPRLRDMVKANVPRTGLSPELTGEWTEDDDGVRDIEHISIVHNVAVVDWPATNTNFSESADTADTDITTKEAERMEWGKVSIETLRAEAPDLVEAIENPLNEKLEKLQADMDALKKSERESAVAAALAEAEIPEAKRTKPFMSAMLTAETEADRKSLIAEHKTLLASAKEDKIESGEKDTVRAPGNIYGGNYPVEDAK